MEFSNYEVPVHFVIETALGHRFEVSGTALVFPNLSVDLAGVSVSGGCLDTRVYLFRREGHLFTIAYLAKCEALLMSGRACPIVRDDLKGIALEKDELEEVETLEGTKWFHRDCLRADYKGKWRHPNELCGAWVDANYKYRVWVGDTYLCPHCGELVVTGFHCGNCETEFEGEWVPKETLAKVVHRDGSDEWMRKRDADSLGLSVCECGNCIAEGDEHPTGLCAHCLNEDDDGDEIIEDYYESHNHNDSPHFVGDFGEKPDSEKKAFGLELEVDRNSWSQNTRYRKRMNCEMAAKISGLIGRNDIRFAYDVSLNDGFEIITQPHSPAAFWKRQSDWAKMLDLLVEWGYKSHNAGTCGLHVHLSRAWFGKTETEQSLAIAKLFAFFYNRWDDISKASRRSDFGYCHRNSYARLENGEWSLGNAVLKWRNCAKKRHSGAVSDEGSAWSHGVALNNCNKNTVEIRVGRGTLNKASFFSWIDFCLALARNASNVTIADCEQKGSAEKWLKGIRESTARYLWKKDAFKKEISALFPEVEWESDERDSSN